MKSIHPSLTLSGRNLPGQELQATLASIEWTYFQPLWPTYTGVSFEL